MIGGRGLGVDEDLLLIVIFESFVRVVSLDFAVSLLSSVDGWRDSWMRTVLLLPCVDFELFLCGIIISPLSLSDDDVRSEWYTGNGVFVASDEVRSRAAIAASTSFSFFPNPQPYPHFDDAVDFLVPVLAFPLFRFTERGLEKPFISLGVLWSPPTKNGTSSYFSESVRKVKLSGSVVNVDVGEYEACLER
jgi:hypothetical protein